MTNDTQVATYYYDGRKIGVFGGGALKGEHRYEYYLLKENGLILNLRHPFSNMPSYKSTKRFLKKNNL